MSRGRTVKGPVRGWHVWDVETSRVHVELPQARSKSAAFAELDALLRHHAADSEWRKRLTVRVTP